MVYFSCHAVADQGGELYFTVADSSLQKLSATAVPVNAVGRQISRTRARHGVLLLDCDHSALERGIVARAGKGTGVWSQLAAGAGR
jgi:hypothetical protein